MNQNFRTPGMQASVTKSCVVPTYMYVHNNKALDNLLKTIATLTGFANAFESSNLV